MEPLRCYRHPDRETYVRCSECDRPICPDCMTMAPVGIRCPEHSGRPQGVQKITRSARRATYEGTGALVTKALVLVNVMVFMANLAEGANLSRNGGRIFEAGALLIARASSAGEPIGLAFGEWWRLVTSAFLHADLRHIFLNMIVLWWIGSPVEEAIGRGRYVATYLVAGFTGSAGALLLSPDAVTVGASGAIWGIMGAAVVLESKRHYVLGGSALAIMALNLLFTFAIPGISIGGHLGGFAGGALCTLAFARFGRTHAIYGRPGLVGAIGVAAIAVAAVAVSYWRVRGYA